MDEQKDHISVETPETQEETIQTHEWYYVGAHRTPSSPEWMFGIPSRDKKLAVDNMKFYINSANMNYEVKIIRIRMPL